MDKAVKGALSMLQHGPYSFKLKVLKSMPICFFAPFELVQTGSLSRQLSQAEYNATGSNLACATDPNG